MVDSTSDALLHEQRAVHELHSLLPLLEERTHQRQDLRAWENAWTKVSEQNRVEVAGIEEDDQQEEVHQRRKRRGGKRNTAWKNKRRQQKDDNERLVARDCHERSPRHLFTPHPSPSDIEPTPSMYFSRTALQSHN
ncbi:hypothetical protein M407DRAFT_133106 [Tulasnella calospora MUT 4182]|uniref:Uncharacterized protein n=1 Tax=Tulasnella calospora MUT 4182 TaxID=1051891 RepID=A0A0C3KH39_9AGAM|nr:hypothetical protein M407DRAFT_133106 [Tulasnella calospora MUT 4182]